ncbi:MAG: hypothetical protein E6305_04195 [Veillonella sp.]|jgi:hypothetical protein|nr:hypothetical protein [Veillonella sp.]
MKFIFLVRVISVILMAGSIGSVELEKIDGYTGFLQIALGVTLLILSNFWVREIKKAR